MLGRFAIGTLMLLLGSLTVAAIADPSAASALQAVPTSTTLRPPLRPPDPPLPEPVHIRSDVSSLVETGLGNGLRVSPLSALESAPAPGSGDSQAIRRALTRAWPALVPLAGAILLLVTRRHGGTPRLRRARGVGA